MVKASQPTVGRLSLYRRLLSGLQAEGATHVFSHRLARLAGGTAAQVRRDIMMLGCSGTPSRDYEISALLACINRLLHPPVAQRIALVGVGNLGRAILAYFGRHQPTLRIAAAFDRDPGLAGQVVAGCRCHPTERLEEITAAEGIRLALLVVPEGSAQAVAERLVAAGIRAIVNFAPVRLNVPRTVHVENIDMTMALERAAFFVRPSSRPGSPVRASSPVAQDETAR